MQDDDTPHLFECVGTMQVRQELYGTVEVDLSALTEYPMRSIALSRRSLRGVGAGSKTTPVGAAEAAASAAAEASQTTH